MLPPRLTCLATALALAAVAAPVPAAGEAACPELLPPAPPVPVRGNPVEGGFQLVWQDAVNGALSTGVDSFQVFRAPLAGSLAEAFLSDAGSIAVVDSLQNVFVDASAGQGEFAYWVRAHNCQGLGRAGNLVTTLACADWEFDSTAVPPLKSAWVQATCAAGSGQPFCFLLIDLEADDLQDMVYREGCDLGA